MPLISGHDAALDAVKTLESRKSEPSVLDMAAEDSASFKHEHSSDADKARVSSLARQQQSLADEISYAESQVKVLKEKHKKIQEESLPEAMDKVGFTKFTTTDGYEVSVKQDMRASVSADRKDQVLDWLEEEGHDAIIQISVAVPFSRGELEVAKEFVEFARGFNQASVNPELDRNVNTGTLKSLVKELMDGGETLPLEMLGVYISRKATIKVPK